MALIKCPECKKDVSTEALSCPNCGFPLTKLFNKNSNKKSPAPKSSEWLNKWNLKPTITKIIVFASFIICLILTIIFVRLLHTDLEAEYNSILNETFYYEKDKWFSASIIFGFLTFFLFVAGITSLFMVKVSIKNIDGYNVIVYWGFWKNHLIIEDYEYDSNWGSIFHNTLLSGELPNGKQITVTLSSGSASFKVDLLSNSSISTPINEYTFPTDKDKAVKNDNEVKKTAGTSTNESKESSDVAEIIKMLNEDLVMLSYQTDREQIEKLKVITKDDYQKLLKCPNASKEDISKMEKRIIDMFYVVDKH